MGTRLKDATDVVFGTGAEGANSTYDTRSGALLTFLILLLAGWIPTIGQIIAGYVGGRKSGSPYRGFIATSAASLCLILVLMIISMFINGINGALATNPQQEIDALAESSPLMAQLLTVMINYLQNIFGNANLTINIGSYLLTVVFGVIGGVLADQSRKETRLIIANAGKTGRRYRSVDSFRKGKSLGFESYQDYTNMTVNSMAVPVQRPAVTVKPAVRKDPVVTETVQSVSAKATPTSSVSTPTSSGATNDGPNPFENIVHMTSPKAEPVSHQDDDVSDCI